MKDKSLSKTLILLASIAGLIGSFMVVGAVLVELSKGYNNINSSLGIFSLGLVIVFGVVAVASIYGVYSYFKKPEVGKIKENGENTENVKINSEIKALDLSKIESEKDILSIFAKTNKNNAVISIVVVSILLLVADVLGGGIYNAYYNSKKDSMESRRYSNYDCVQYFRDIKKGLKPFNEECHNRVNEGLKDYQGQDSGAPTSSYDLNDSQIGLVILAESWQWTLPIILANVAGFFAIFKLVRIYKENAKVQEILAQKQ